ncbi:MAG: TraR/DksA C4-type zinc finger protein [Chloroflexota bacterium]
MATRKTATKTPSKVSARSRSKTPATVESKTERSSARSDVSKSASKNSTARTARDPLAQKAAEAQELLEAMNRTSFAGDEREVADELSALDQHPSEHADITLQRELDYTIRDIVDDDLAQIREAMQRKADGTYGTCTDCGNEIPKARLEARPEATRCIECQRRFEGVRM